MNRTTRLWAVLVLNLVLVGGLVATGIVAHSLGVLAAGGDYLADAGAVAVALFAIRLRDRGASSSGRTYANAPAYAAFLNAALLLVVVGFVVVEAVQRLIAGTEPVHGGPVLVASATAAVVMTAAALVLGGDDDLDDDTDADRANMRAVLLDTVADAAAATGVAVTGAIILLTHGWYWLDPAVALVIPVLIGYHTVVLLRDVLATLRAPSPAQDDPWT